MIAAEVGERPHRALAGEDRARDDAALDMAAMETVKLACPLHMKHAIGKPQIVMSLPIVYSLAN